MPVPDFSPGEVLTAAAMDQVGMWLVKSVTIPASPVSTAVDVTSCFSGDYQNYQVVYTGQGNGSAVFHNLQLLSGVSPANTFYYRNGTTMTSNSTTVGGSAVAAGTSFDLGAQQAGTEEFSGVINFQFPFEARHTTIQGYESTFAGGFGYNYTFQGCHAVNTSYNGFRISVSTGSFNTGAIRVYGLRN
jgi:hypothetical protein